MIFNDCEVIIKPYSDFTFKEKVSWIDNCNIAYNFDRAAYILQKYEARRNNLFCLLVDKSNIRASYSGFFCETSGLSSFLSTDTFSLSRHSTSFLGNYLYDHLSLLGCDFVFGWPNERIKKIRSNYLHWVYLGYKNVYLAYPRISPQVALKSQKGPFDRSKGSFVSRSQSRFIRTLDNFSVPSSQNYRCINITLGTRNPFFNHVPIPGKSKLFGYRILCQDNSERINTVVNELFSFADLSWIDVP